MKILIIGSKGFIGGNCVKYFSKKYDVHECDITFDYNTKNYHLIDATNSDYFEIFQKNKFDVCLNCSGAASVPNSIKNPLQDFTLNTYNVYKQLDAIRKFNEDCKYLNLSSAAVYGNPTKLPISEKMDITPISPYGKHKKIAEDICNEFYFDFGIKTSSLRIFSAFGQGLKKQLFWDLYKNSDKDIITLFGTGNESRDFIYIDDLVRIIEIVIIKSNFMADVINVANGEETKIVDAVKLFFKHYKPETVINFSGENRSGDPNNWKADIKKIRGFGYKRKYSFEEGLIEYVKWLKGKN